VPAAAGGGQENPSARGQKNGGVLGVLISPEIFCPLTENFFIIFTRIS